MKKVYLSLILLFSCAALFGQGTCAGVHFTPIAEYPVALGSNYSFSSFIIGNGDFDNDGKEDLAFIGRGIKDYKNHLVLQRNIRTGTLPSQVTFDTSVSIFTSSGTMDFVVNDFNNDGKPDIAITFGPSGLDSLEILINNGTAGTFSFLAMPVIPLSTSEIYPTLKTNDFDHDGKNDIMYQGSDNKVYVVLNTGYTSTSATFSTTASYTGIMFHGSSSYTYRSFSQGDMNGDSLPEVAYPGYNTDTMFVWKNTSTKGSISYKLAQAYICPENMSTGMFWDGNYVQIRDVNGDKKADISVLYDYSGGSYGQRLLFLKNVGTGSNVQVTFSDTMELNHFAKSKQYVIDTMNDTLSYATFSDFSFIYNDPCHLKPDILLSTEGASQKWSVISYLSNTSTLSKISYSAPCWFQHFTADRASVGDFNGDNKDDLLSMCDVCLPGSPNYGLSILENISTVKVFNESIAFDTVSVACKANKTGGMKIKLYLPCHALANIAKDSVVIVWKPKVSTSDTATLQFGTSYSVHVYKQSKSYDTTFTLAFKNPYSVGQNGLPISMSFSDTTSCPGAPIQLRIKKSSTVNHYLWSPNTNMDNDTLANPTVSPTTVTTYHVSGSGGQCLRDTSVIVRIHPKPSIKVVPASDTTVCPGSPVILRATGCISYTWTPKRHLNKDTGASVLATVDSTTYFSIEGFDGKCYGYGSAAINTATSPIVYAGASWTLHSNEHYTILDASITGSYFKYWWTPGTYMNDSTILNPTINATQSMVYYLHAINANGCVSEDSVIIKYDPMGHIFVPNSFTPNHDGVNDNWIVKNENIREFHLVVYDRWGEIVFETLSPNTSWNGQCNGMDEPIGSYVYYIRATDIGGHQIDMKGNITLLR